MTWIPKITTQSDFDNYFTDLVKEWCLSKTTPFKSKEIIITAGPYRADALTCKPIKDPNSPKGQYVLHLDFYSEAALVVLPKRMPKLSKTNTCRKED